MSRGVNNWFQLFVAGEKPRRANKHAYYERQRPR